LWSSQAERWLRLLTPLMEKSCNVRMEMEIVLNGESAYSTIIGSYKKKNSFIYKNSPLSYKCTMAIMDLFVIQLYSYVILNLGKENLCDCRQPMVVSKYVFAAKNINTCH
jgi:hypothetical protein